jgi:hypothetical protein
MKTPVLTLVAMAAGAVVATPWARATTIRSWLSANDSQVYVIHQPPVGPGSPGGVVPAGVSPVEGVSLSPGDAVVLSLGGCVNVGGRWVPYTKASVGGVEYYATAWIPGVGQFRAGPQALGGLGINGSRLQVSSIPIPTKGAVKTAPVLLYLGYAHSPAHPGPLPVGYDGAKPSDPNDPCFTQPDALVTVTVTPSDATLLRRLSSLTPGPGAFDTVQLDNDPTGSLPVNPLFSGQLQACQLALASNFKPTAPTCFAGTGAPYAEWDTTCSGFPLNGFAADNAAIASTSPCSITSNTCVDATLIPNLRIIGPPLIIPLPGSCDASKCCYNKQTASDKNFLLPCLSDADCAQKCAGDTDASCSSYTPHCDHCPYCTCDLSQGVCTVTHAPCQDDSDCQDGGQCPLCTCRTNADCSGQGLGGTCLYPGRCFAQPEAGCVTNGDCSSGATCVYPDCASQAAQNLIVADWINDVAQSDYPTTLCAGGSALWGTTSPGDQAFGYCNNPNRPCSSNCGLPTQNNAAFCAHSYLDFSSPAVNQCDNGINCLGRTRSLLYNDLCTLKAIASQASRTFFGLFFKKTANMVFDWSSVLEQRWRFWDFLYSPVTNPTPGPNTCRSQPADDPDASRLCSIGHFFAPNASGNLTGFAGHVNFEPAMFIGRLRFATQSGPTPKDEIAGWDDADLNWNLLAPAGEGAGGSYGEIHVENSRVDSLAEFRETRQQAAQAAAAAGLTDASALATLQNDFWTGLEEAAESDDAAISQFLTAAPQLHGPSMLCSRAVQPCTTDRDCGGMVCTAGNCVPPCNGGTCIYLDANVRSYLAGEAGNGTGFLDQTAYAPPGLILGHMTGRERFNVKMDGTVQDCGAVPASMPGAHAIVIGEVGLDCYHGCQPEIHPAYAMFVRRQATLGTLGKESWSFFVRRSGNEGFCSQGFDNLAQCGVSQCEPEFDPFLPSFVHSLPVEHVEVFIPRPAARDVVPWFNVVAKICPDSGCQVGAGSPGVPSWGNAAEARVQVETVTGQGALVRVDLGPDSSGETAAWVEGDFDLTWEYLPLLKTAPGLPARLYSAEFKKIVKQWIKNPAPWQSPTPPEDIRSKIQTTGQQNGNPTMNAFAVHLAASMANGEPEGDQEALQSFIGDPVFRLMGRLKAEAPATYAAYRSAVEDMNGSLNAIYNLSPRTIGCLGTPKAPVTIIDTGDAPGLPGPSGAASSSGGASAWWQTFETKQREAINRSRDISCALLSGYADELPFPCNGSVPWPTGRAAPPPALEASCTPDAAVFRQGHVCVEGPVVLKRRSRFTARIKNPGALCASAQKSDTLDIVAPNGDIVEAFVTDNPTVVHVEGMPETLRSLFRSMTGTALLTKESDGRIHGQPMRRHVSVSTTSTTRATPTTTSTSTTLTTTTTTTSPPQCGNGIIESGEQCDPPGDRTQCGAGFACQPDCTCPPG